eukprot:g10000.t1
MFWNVLNFSSSGLQSTAWVLWIEDSELSTQCKQSRPAGTMVFRTNPMVLSEGQVSEARVTRSMSLASKYQQSKVLEGNPSPAQSNTVARRGSRGGLANKYSSLNGKPSRTYSTPSSTFYSPQPPQPPTETVVNMIPAVVHSPSEQSIPRYGDIFRSLRETDLKEFFKPQKCVMLEHSPHAGRKRSLSLSPTYCKPLKLPPRTLRPSSGSSGPPPLPSKSRRTLKSSASAGSVNRQPTVQAQIRQS